MRRLNKNYWRLGWVLFTNGAVILLLLTGPIRDHHDQQLIYQAMRTTSPAFSYWQEFFRDPWIPALTAILLTGIILEVSRNVLSPVLNLAPLMFWLVSALRDAFYSKQLLLILPLAVVIVVDLVFYALAFRARQADGGNVGVIAE